jgi:hypothetical protein
MLNLEIKRADGRAHRIGFAPKSLTIAGWTGRNPSLVQNHIEELVKIGVKAPEEVPAFYRVRAGLLTTMPILKSPGNPSTGEAEFCLMNIDDDIYVSVGSDHTDRVVETRDVTLSKQICVKPVSAECWRLADVIDHWDALQLRSFITVNGIERQYQDGTVAEILHATDLLALVRSAGLFERGDAVFGGTIPIIGDLCSSDSFRAELHDPVLGRTLTCTYHTKVI